MESNNDPHVSLPIFVISEKSSKYWATPKNVPPDFLLRTITRLLFLILLEKLIILICLFLTKNSL